MPEEGIRKKSHEEILRLEEIEALARIFVSLGIDKIRITGGEPLIRKGITNLIRNIGKIYGLSDLSITTNGTLLKKHAKSLYESGIKRINISLDSLESDKYALITRGGKLDEVLQGLKEAKLTGFNPIKINIVLIKGFNDDEIENFVNLTYDGTDIRFIELMPIGSSAGWSSSRFLPNSYVLDRIKALRKQENPDISSSAVIYRLPGASGTVGLISPVSCRFCRLCNRIRLTSDGKLLPCLYSGISADLKSILRGSKANEIRNTIRKFIMQKPATHSFNANKSINNMVQIGG